MVITGRRGEVGQRESVQIANELGIEIVLTDRALVEAAYQGWLRYGKRRHAAGLNYGDCFSYALAKLRQEPLLFKGDDFSQTDIGVGV